MTVLDLKRRILEGLASGELPAVPTGTEIVEYARKSSSCGLCEQPVKRGSVQIELVCAGVKVSAHRDCFNLLWQLSRAGRTTSI